ncbi:MAG: hypothetical protein ACQEWM_06475 [Actinomycetota bacterium]
MRPTDTALSLTVVGAPELGSGALQALYRITGRATGELRRAVRAGEPLYIAALFGSDHIDVVPRLQRTVDYLDGLGLPCTIHEWNAGGRTEISRDAMRAILEVTEVDER